MIHGRVGRHPPPRNDCVGSDRNSLIGLRASWPLANAGAHFQNGFAHEIELERGEMFLPPLIVPLVPRGSEVQVRRLDDIGSYRRAGTAQSRYQFFKISFIIMCKPVGGALGCSFGAAVRVSRTNTRRRLISASWRAARP